MRLRIQFAFRDPLFLPQSYQRALQGMIYSAIDDEKVRFFLHEEGFLWKKRRFKPFVFSWMQGSFRMNSKGFLFDSPVHLYISSCWEPFIQALSHSLLNRSCIVLHHQPVTIDEVDMLEEPEFGTETVVKTLSPVTMYSTLQTAEGRKVTHYYDVREKAFSDLIHKNLVKKAQTLYNLDLNQSSFSIEPVGKVKPTQQKRIYYKGFLIKAWHGTFRMRGDPTLQKVAYQVGAGGKNAQGFGMLDFVSSDGGTGE
ncbi:CRISPR-associated endoribonuclease Cas6 [Paludifilum halophilum]|uniref:CRISPR-associated endoribonuclease n=1 Tax=Paludifilum halophilum TaxID=1642702 RepID=A0A235B3L9_9BACL|nr:CRISPR-associated endoribonuclease Cas6 [Paludifilum halophilum]OYD06225.1 CRISPR-associated endoribonuclease Cas6 [Paludifilum halophilum]